MICSSVNRFRFIVSVFNQGRTLIPSGGIYPWQVKADAESSGLVISIQGKEVGDPERRNRKGARDADNAPSRAPSMKAAIVAFDAVFTNAAMRMAATASAAEVCTLESRHSGDCGQQKHSRIVHIRCHQIRQEHNS